MSGPARSIAGAPFLAEPGFRAVIAMIEARGGAARAVGGAVRNALLGEPVEDVDVATTARPEAVLAAAAAAGFNAVPTGIDHGTVTVVAHGAAYEVTTLRADVETDGRHAVVRFTDDWAADAARRDFTMNAVYADVAGRLTDPTGGIADAFARRVRFIGAPEDRIREDYLRILRFFRFHARYGTGAPDERALAACVALKDGLTLLSRERIGMEIRKLLLAPAAGPTLLLMAEAGILDGLFGKAVSAAAIDAAFSLAREAGIPLTVETGLALLATASPTGAVDIAESLRLSRAEAEGVADILAWSARLGPRPGAAAIREAVYRAGNAVTVGALLHAAATQGAALPPDVAIARSWTAPAFPVGGRDLIAAGVRPGPELGRRLKEIEAHWIAEGFPPRSALERLLAGDQGGGERDDG